MPKNHTIVTNRKARHEYQIIDTLEAGIVLTGSEVKSLCNNNASLEGSYVRVMDGEVFLVGSHIGEYKDSIKNVWVQHEPLRKRKLLMHKKEIEKFAEKSEQKGLTIVPLKLFFNNRGKIKVEIAVGQGKKLHDKRQSEKKKQADLDMRRGKNA